MTKKAAVLGKPIAHSLSPVIHNAAYRACGLDYEYVAVEVAEGHLGEFIAGCDESWAGLSLTMPLKVEGLQLAAKADSVATLSGAVNTLLFRDQLEGYNTDVYGLVTAINEIRKGEISRATVLGSGATARSAILALHELNVSDVCIVARNPVAVGELIELSHKLDISPTLLQFDTPEWGACDLVISTLPGGANLELPAGFEFGSLLFDVAYSPWPSSLANQWITNGGKASPGHLMLLHQAARQFELMTGHSAPIVEMREALTTSLARK